VSVILLLMQILEGGGLFKGRLLRRSLVTSTILAGATTRGTGLTVGDGDGVVVGSGVNAGRMNVGHDKRLFFLLKEWKSGICIWC